MFISHTESAAKGFKKWSTVQPAASNDDDRPGGATPIALTGVAGLEPVAGAAMTHKRSVG
jgi:hypothetical protein